MKNKLYFKTLFTLMLLTLVSTMVLVSCDEEDKAPSGVILDSFGPAGVKHGEEVKFIGKNLDLVQSIQFVGVEVTKAQFKSQSKTIIELIVPDEAQAGRVILKSTKGNVESKSTISFDVPVSISSITSPVKPGENLVIRGEFVNWIEEIVFNNGLSVTSFESSSVKELVVKVPMAAQTGFLTFRSGGTEPVSFSSEEEIEVSIPVITQVGPLNIKHTDVLTITGEHLDLVTEVVLPGNFVVTNFNQQTSGEIKLSIPVGTQNGTFTLKQESPISVTSTDAINILLPQSSQIDPSNTDDHVAGTTLTIVGTNLSLVKAIKFPGVATPVSTLESQTDTKIEVKIPEGISGGTVMFVTIHDYLTPISAPFGDQLILTTVLFDDAVSALVGKGGGWNADTDWENTEVIRVGTKAVKVNYTDHWGGGAQFGTWGKSPLSMVGLAYFAFSMYGGEGTEGLKIQVKFPNDEIVSVIIKEGKWTDITIPLVDLGNPLTVDEIAFQCQEWTGVVYFDHIGFK
jgi:hypothetical protein